MDFQTTRPFLNTGNSTFQLSMTVLVLFWSYTMQVMHRPYMSTGERGEVIKELHRRAKLFEVVPARAGAPLFQQHSKRHRAMRCIQSADPFNLTRRRCAPSIRVKTLCCWILVDGHAILCVIEAPGLSSGNSLKPNASNFTRATHTPLSQRGAG